MIRVKVMFSLQVKKPAIFIKSNTVSQKLTRFTNFSGLYFLNCFMVKWLFVNRYWLFFKAGVSNVMLVQTPPFGGMEGGKLKVLKTYRFQSPSPPFQRGKRNLQNITFCAPPF